MNYNFYELIKPKSSLGKELRSLKSPVVYRIYQVSTGMNYIGSTKSVKSRIWGIWGYIRVVELGQNMSPIHEAIKYSGWNDFEFIIEEITDSIDKAIQLEEVYITQYDSFFNGFNETPDGKGGKLNVTYITDGVHDKMVSDKWMLNHIIPENWKIGRTSKPNQEKVHVNNGVDLRYIYEYELDEYLNKGYVKGTLNRPSKDRTVMNNGIHDKFVKPEDIELYRSMGYIEGGLKGLNCRKKIWINNGEKNTKIDPSELIEYMSKGWFKGRLTLNKK